MANTKDFKVKNSIKPTAYYEAVGTVTTELEATDDYGLWHPRPINSFDISSQTTAPLDVFFKTDGTEFFVLVTGGIYTYTLSTAWDVSTASYDSFNNVFSGLDAFYFKEDGTKLFTIVSDASTGTINQYNLSPAWDVSSVTSATADHSKSNSNAINAVSLNFNPDGDKLYVLDTTNDKIKQFSLGSAWDLSGTLTFDNATSAFPAGLSTPHSMDFNSDGTSVYVSDAAERFATFPLTTAYDVTTGDYSTTVYAFNDTDDYRYLEDVRGLTFANDHKYFYTITHTAGASVFQFVSSVNKNTLDMSTGSVFEVTASNTDGVGGEKIVLSNPPDSGTVGSASVIYHQGLFDIFQPDDFSYTNKSAEVQSGANGVTFKPDGTVMYIASTNTTYSVLAYDLSTAWDVSTAETTASVTADSSKYLGLPAESSQIRQVLFSSDGTKMFLRGHTEDTLFQYSLSPAWDVSSATYDSVSLNHNADDGNGSDIAFNDDGTKLYLIGGANDIVIEYTLPTAYNLTSASKTDTYTTVISSENAPQGVTFNPEGTVMVTSGNTNDLLYWHTLTTPYDLTSAAYMNTTYDHTTEVAATQSLSTSADGRYLYVLGQNDVYQYEAASLKTLSFDTNIEFEDGSAPTNPDYDETDLIVFSTRDGGTSYQAALAVDGAK